MIGTDEPESANGFERILCWVAAGLAVGLVMVIYTTQLAQSIFSMCSVCCITCSIDIIYIHTIYAYMCVYTYGFARKNISNVAMVLRVLSTCLFRSEGLHEGGRGRLY